MQVFRVRAQTRDGQSLRGRLLHAINDHLGVIGPIDDDYGDYGVRWVTDPHNPPQITAIERLQFADAHMITDDIGQWPVIKHGDWWYCACEEWRTCEPNVIKGLPPVTRECAHTLAAKHARDRAYGEQR